MEQPARPRSTPTTPHPSTETAVFTDAGLSAVIFDGRSCTVHRLNTSSAAVWLLVDGQTTPAQIAEQLVAVGAATALEHAAVELALDDFWRLGLLLGSPATGTGCS